MNVYKFICFRLKWFIKSIPTSKASLHFMSTNYEMKDMKILKLQETMVSLSKCNI